MVKSIRVVEFFCGIGGCAASLTPEKTSLGIDINQRALEVYRANFSHPTLCKSIESISETEAHSWQAELWWMSPPCQPYTRRGLQRDVEDRRAAGFLHLIGLIGRVRPNQIAIENVPGFKTSKSRRMLIQQLQDAGYAFREIELCPTQLGGVNRRLRYYLIASHEGVRPWHTLDTISRSELRLEPSPDTTSLELPKDWVDKYLDALHFVQSEQFLNSLDGAGAYTRCFTSAYGRSPVRSGSYLRHDNILRFFSPQEILWQLGFDDSFLLPNWPNSKLWPLVGNSLATPCVEYVLGHFAENSFN